MDIVDQLTGFFLPISSSLPLACAPEFLASVQARNTIWTLCEYHLQMSHALDLMPPDATPAITEAWHAAEPIPHVTTSADSFISEDKGGEISRNIPLDIGIMGSQPLFNFFKRPWMLKVAARSTIQYHEFQFFPTQVLGIPSVNFKFTPEDLMRMSYLFVITQPVAQGSKVEARSYFLVQRMAGYETRQGEGWGILPGLDDGAKSVPNGRGVDLSAIYWRHSQYALPKTLRARSRMVLIFRVISWQSSLRHATDLLL
ncbi:hypothetical protein IW261DRAFT_1635032 [Armillaria novae-zelandiae]|uniref:Uncharacterized protein n=1 Tax=Armillaria novae-zelandiae TaxID=153914 RepID=A0AA39KGG5_9AGAR|nr:hypothetical protein IW261DRAFT_1635032 [Armillaria novae-zelandiae]